MVFYVFKITTFVEKKHTSAAAQFFSELFVDFFTVFVI